MLRTRGGGSGPTLPSVDPSPGERFAFEMIPRALPGVTVEHRDTGASDRQGEVDAHIVYPDGRRAALEVTTLVGQAEAEIEARLVRDNFTWDFPDLDGFWMCSVGPHTDLRAAKEKLPILLSFCEEQNVRDPDLLHLAAHPLIQWFRDADLSAGRSTHTPDGRAGTVAVTPTGAGGAVGNMEGVSDWLSTVVREPHCARKVDKLVRSGLSELHLFVAVDGSGAPFAEFYGMCWGEGLPADTASIEPLAAVWIIARWATDILLYRGNGGWSRVPVREPQLED